MRDLIKEGVVFRVDDLAITQVPGQGSFYLKPRLDEKTSKLQFWGFAVFQSDLDQFFKETIYRQLQERRLSVVFDLDLTLLCTVAVPNDTSHKGYQRALRTKEEYEKSHTGADISFDHNGYHMYTWFRGDAAQLLHGLSTCFEIYAYTHGTEDCNGYVVKEANRLKWGNSRYTRAEIKLENIVYREDSGFERGYGHGQVIKKNLDRLFPTEEFYKYVIAVDDNKEDVWCESQQDLVVQIPRYCPGTSQSSNMRNAIGYLKFLREKFWQFHDPQQDKTPERIHEIVDNTWIARFISKNALWRKPKRNRSSSPGKHRASSSSSTTLSKKRSRRGGDI